MKKLLSYLMITSSLLCLYVPDASAQRLRIDKEDMKQKIGALDKHATIIVESAVKGLEVNTTSGDTIVQAASSIGKTWTIDVDLERERALGSAGLLKRKVILRSPSSSQLAIDIPGNNQTLQQATYYYTVILPDKFPSSFSVEWLFSGASKKGVRIGYGTRYGGYISYKWGDYQPSGHNIDDVTVDADLSKAKFLGYIRQSINAGIRIGIFSYDRIKCFTLLGGGYGVYGRQWDNYQKVDGNRYFYSDFIKGFNANLGLSFVLFDGYTVSGGLDVIIDNGRTNMDFEIGVGIGFEKNFFKGKNRR